MIEEWRDVVGYEGLYRISNLGRVETIRRQGSDGRILKSRSLNGYLTVALCKNGEYKRKQVHRLVAESFIPNPRRYPCVNHKDENKENNFVGNLEWCSVQYNNNYGTARARASIARYKPCIGIWPDGTVRKYNSCTLASKDTGISQGNIWGACNGLWTHAGGARWEYQKSCEP